MWTPKRIVLLVLGFALFFAGYFSYTFVLGGIDGLPPLPDCYLSKVDDPGGESLSRSPTKHSTLEEKFKQAFGPDCTELDHPIKLELHAKRTALAAREFAGTPACKLCGV